MWTSFNRFQAKQVHSVLPAIFKNIFKYRSPCNLLTIQMKCKLIWTFSYVHLPNLVLIPNDEWLSALTSIFVKRQKATSQQQLHCIHINPICETNTIIIPHWVSLYFHFKRDGHMTFGQQDQQQAHRHTAISYYLVCIPQQLSPLESLLSLTFKFGDLT